MCGCAGGGGGSFTPNFRVQSQNIIITPCEYTTDILIAWRNLLMCVKNNNLLDIFHISKAVLNSYLGYVISAINYATNICFFKPQLDNLQPLILQIINSGECQ